MHLPSAGKHPAGGTLGDSPDPSKAGYFPPDVYSSVSSPFLDTPVTVF